MNESRTHLFPWILLGAMTLFTFGGPVVIGAVLRGGARPSWPPDRPVEWATLLSISGAVLVMMALCLVLALANNRRLRATPPPRHSGEDR